MGYLVDKEDLPQQLELLFRIANSMAELSMVFTKSQKLGIFWQLNQPPGANWKVMRESISNSHENTGANYTRASVTVASVTVDGL